MNIFSYIMGSIFIVASLIAGILLRFFPPKTINAWYGVKTKATSKNKETWVYGHKVCAITLLIYSFFSILAYIIILVIAKNFLTANWYLRIIFGLVFALVGVAIAGITTEIKTKQYGKEIVKKE